jgi:c-di-AMP phosphodiesterase-like protein
MYNKKNGKKTITILYLISSFFALGGLFGAGYLISIMPDKFLYISLFCACALFLILTIAAISLNSAHKRNEVEGPHANELLAIMFEKIKNLNEPAFICDSHGKFLWYNEFMQRATGQKSPILGAKVSHFIKSELFEEGEIADVDFSGRTYSVDRSKIKSNDKSYFLFVLRDITEKIALEKELRDTDKLIAFVVVDNLDELLQFEQEKYREASSEIGNLIRDWASSVNGVIKEYERDKYIFIFDAQYLDVFRTEKLN